MTVWNPSLFFLWYCYESIILPLVGAHKYVWLASPDRPDFCSKVRAGWSAPIKTKNKLKGRFIYINHLLVIEISIFLTWDNFKGYVLTKSNLALFQLTFVKIRLTCQYWRGLRVLFRICYSRYLKLVVMFPEHFMSCHAQAETDLKTELAEFQHKPEDKFSQKEFHCINLKTIS